jgi:predicted nucleic acid-binding protein
MGLIVDTSILIAAERRRDSIASIMGSLRAVSGDDYVAASAISVVELTHGIYRAKTTFDAARRKLFVEEAFLHLIVHPVSFEIARLAGRIEGEQAAKGIRIELQDLVIGVTALHLGYDVATLNVKHFKLIPGLNIVSL